MYRQFEQHQAVGLLAEKNQKPIDVGCGRLSASIGRDGRLRSVNHSHPGQGFITLVPIEQFPNDQWYNSGFVRKYRRRLVELSLQEGPEDGFGIKPAGEILKQEVYYLEHSAPLFTYQLEGMEIKSLFLAVEEKQRAYLIQQLVVKNVSDQKQICPFEIGGQFSLNRCSYGQLTEGGPISMPPLENELKAGDQRISITNRKLPATVDILLYNGKEPIFLSPAQMNSNEPIQYLHREEISLEPGEVRTIHMVYTVTPQKKGIDALSYEELDQLIHQSMERLPLCRKDQGDIQSFIIGRNIDYILSCCSVPVTEEHMCVITDHQLLPLSWNRDAYYMMQLLLESEKRADLLFEDSYQVIYKKQVQQIIKGHLLWMFETACRPERYWGRAYLTNGFCKDNVFQLDQQCYPLLELCDYYERFRDQKTVERVLPIANEILDMMMEYKDAQKWLFLTGETPADDEVEYPYHFSSQVLVWYTMKQLAKLNEEFFFTGMNLAEWAENVKRDCLEFFVTTRNGKEMFAYLTDLKGNYQLYHDANDLPSVYAPVWGLCRADDPKWLHTMEFAFSECNQGGFYAGEFGGLGSIHTPHAWPLGDAQELLYSQLTQNDERQKKVIQKMERVVQWDGLFSEAIHEQNGHVESRHWFSWPGAYMSTVLLQTKGMKS